ncbi:MAG: hypothetical protein VX460_11460 [Planctomycetota bacterium]|nr:hypothetical protein [Planctomycetota bacterium]
MDARKIRALLLVAVAAASAAAARQDAPPPQADDSAAQLTSRETLRAVLDSAPARTRVGGMRGARVASRVVFDSAPQRPHELLLSAAFPARTRVELVSADGRVERYQLGRALFGRDVTRERRSPDPGHALTGPGAIETELDLALRRAVFFWPDALQFVGAGRTRTAKVRTLGVLVADLDQDTGRPRKMTAYGPDGRASASFREITWKERGRRAWPDTFEFWAGDRRIWREAVTEADDRWVFGDPWFMPPDLMGKAIGEGEDAPVRMRPSDRAFELVERLPAPIGIDSATRALAARWSELDRTVEAEQLELEESAALRLDSERRVIALEFRIPRGGSPAKERAPAGWAPVEGTSCWVVQAGEEAASLERAFEHLERLVRERRTIGAARLRISLERREDGPKIGVRALEASAVEQAAPGEAKGRAPDRR